MKTEFQKKYEKARIRAFWKYAKFIISRRKTDNVQDEFLNLKEIELNLKQLVTKNLN